MKPWTPIKDAMNSGDLRFLNRGRPRFFLSVLECAMAGVEIIGSQLLQATLLTVRHIQKTELTMRRLAIFLWCSWLMVPSVVGQTKSALESDGSGWTNLLADKSMKDWVRMPLAGNPIVRAGSMSDPSPWRLGPSGEILTCDGKNAGHELLRYASELKDFVVHVEYRHVPVEGETRYNSGVYVRGSLDGTIWHQAQATLPGGFLMMNTLVKGVTQRVNLQKEMKENRVKPAGEWNVYEIRAVGKQITLWVNGAIVNEFNDCEVLSGYLGLEAEGYGVEFRNVQLKRLP
jgi:hypothetical protein